MVQLEVDKKSDKFYYADYLKKTFCEKSHRSPLMDQIIQPITETNEFRLILSLDFAMRIAGRYCKGWR